MKRLLMILLAVCSALTLHALEIILKLDLADALHIVVAEVDADDAAYLLAQTGLET